MELDLKTTLLTRQRGREMSGAKGGGGGGGDAKNKREAESPGAALPAASATAAGMGDGELLLLRRLLLAPEQEVLRKILFRLDDPATRARETAAALPEALAQLDDAGRAAVVGGLRDLIRDAVAEVLREPQATAAPQAPRRKGPGQFIRTLFARKVKHGARLEQWYLERQVDGQWTELDRRHALGHPDQTSRDDSAGANRLEAMARCWLDCVRDSQVLQKYVAQRYVRVEAHIFAFHAAGPLLLLSVIRAEGDTGLEDEIARCAEILRGYVETGGI